MLDTTTALAATTPWADSLTPGDIVMFRFPCADDGAPKPRPCLVLATRRIDNEMFAEIVYGTSADTNANRGFEIGIKTDAGMALAGLAQPTRFVGTRRVIVSVAHSAFAISPTHPSPVIGRLDNAALERMYALRDRIHELRDIIVSGRSLPRSKRAAPVSTLCTTLERRRARALAAARRRAAEAAKGRVGR